MPRRFKPIPCQEFPTDEKTLARTNCLAFALGIKTVSKRNRKKYILENQEGSIETIFLKKVKELRFNPKDFKLLRKEEEWSAEGYIIRVYCFRTEMYNGSGTTCKFHVIRREPNGKWVHKPGFFYQPYELTSADWNAIGKQYGSMYISFSVQT